MDYPIPIKPNPTYTTKYGKSLRECDAAVDDNGVASQIGCTRRAKEKCGNHRFCSRHFYCAVDGHRLDGRCRFINCEVEVDPMRASRRDGYCPTHYNEIEDNRIINQFNEEFSQPSPGHGIMSIYNFYKIRSKPKLTTDFVRAACWQHHQLGYQGHSPPALLTAIGPQFSNMRIELCHTQTPKAKTPTREVKFDMNDCGVLAGTGFGCFSTLNDVSRFVQWYNNKYLDAIKVIESMGVLTLTHNAARLAAGNYQNEIRGGDKRAQFRYTAPVDIMPFLQGEKWIFIESASMARGTVYRTKTFEAPVHSGKWLCDDVFDNKYINSWEEFVSLVNKLYGGGFRERDEFEADDLIEQGQVGSNDIMPQLLWPHFRKIPANNTLVEKMESRIEDYASGGHTQQNDIVWEIIAELRKDGARFLVEIEESDEGGDLEVLFADLSDDNFEIICHTLFIHLGKDLKMTIKREYADIKTGDWKAQCEIVRGVASRMATHCLRQEESSLLRGRSKALQSKIKERYGEEKRLVDGFYELGLEQFPKLDYGKRQIARNRRKYSDGNGGKGGNDSESEDDDWDKYEDDESIESGVSIESDADEDDESIESGRGRGRFE